MKTRSKPIDFYAIVDKWMYLYGIHEGHRYALAYRLREVCQEYKAQHDELQKDRP